MHSRCLKKTQEESKCAVINLHTQQKQTFFALYVCDELDILLSFKHHKILPTKYNYLSCK